MTLFPCLLSFSKQRACEMCCTENRRQVLPKASFSCFTRSERFLQTSSLILLYRRRPLARRQTFSMNQKAVTPLALACQNSLTFTGSMPDSRVGIWVSSEESEECPGVGEQNRENLAFKALISFKRFKWSKGRQFSPFLFCCSHYKSTSKESPPLTICCIVS